MAETVKKLLKINLRARSKDNIHRLLGDVLGGELVSDRGSDTIGDFLGSTFVLGGVMFDIVVPTKSDSPLSQTIDKYGEGIDSICFATENMNDTRKQLEASDITFSRVTEFHGNKVAFVHPRNACGIGIEFIEGPMAEINS